MPFKTISKPGLNKKVYSISFYAISASDFEAKKLATIEEMKLNGATDEEIQAVINEPIPQIKLKATIQEQQFKELALGLGALMTMTGNMDLATAGKIIFDTCCTDYDAELDTNPKAMIKLCMELAADYVIPISADIKKN